MLHKVLLLLLGSLVNDQRLHYTLQRMFLDINNQLVYGMPLLRGLGRTWSKERRMRGEKSILSQRRKGLSVLGL